MNIYTASTSRESNICEQLRVRPQIREFRESCATHCVTAVYSIRQSDKLFIMLRKSLFQGAKCTFSGDDMNLNAP